MSNFLNQKDTAQPIRHLSANSLLIVSLILIILAGGGLAYWYLDRASQPDGVSLKDLPEQPQLSPEEIQDILKKVGRHIVLPEGEPLIATVQDAASLKQVQPFFGLSEDGDQLLVYPNKAFIYRPDEDKLINVGPVYRSDAPAAPEASQDIKLELRNGSNKAGAARALGDQLAGLSGYAISQITNAATSTYAQSAIVNLTGKNITPIRQQLNINNLITALPTGEAPSAADAVVIVGNDRVAEGN